MIPRLQLAKEIIKDSILNKTEKSINDTNIYIDYLKFLDRSYSINNTLEHAIKQDVSEIMSFFIDKKIPLLNIDCITQEVNKEIPKLIAQKTLTNKAPYNLEELRANLTFSSDIYYPTEEDIRLSEEYGWKYFAFNKKKDNRTDLLIFICARKNKIKIIITSNHQDFIWCNEVYSSKINPNDKEEILILTPAEMHIVIDDLKKEMKK